MAWRLAESLKTLRTQINTLFPNRDKKSDGSIGDPRHQAKGSKSDHNPNGAGVVTAIDVTHDPKTGVNCHNLAQALFASKDPRIKYLIWNGQITVQNGGGIIAGWKTYGGSNPHKHHLHISAASNPKLYDSTAEWNLSALNPCSNPPAINQPSVSEPPIETAPIYTVRSGDYLGRIARDNQTTVERLKALNNLKSDVIFPGQKLRLK